MFFNEFHFEIHIVLSSIKSERSFIEIERSYYKVENLEDVRRDTKIFENVEPHVGDRSDFLTWLNNLTVMTNDETEECFKLGDELATALRCTIITHYYAVSD